MKSNLLCILSLGTFFSGFSQLSIKNDYAIIVKDQVIFVKDAVNLTNTTSKIYFRDEAQLVQGDGMTGNSGLGDVSVYQEGTVNHWAYNYWCSPVGNNTMDNAINNAFAANLIDDPLLATPDVTDSDNTLFTNLYNGSAPPLTISKRWIYTFDDDNNDQSSTWNHVGQNLDIKPGLGFTMKGIGSGDTGNQTYDFRGKPNNGDIYNTVINGQYTLVGNPYPSALDALEFIHDTHNSQTINGTLYFWEQKSTGSHVLADYEGGYATYTISSDGAIASFTKALFSKYNGSGEVVDPGSPSDSSKEVFRYIPIGQGFMVEGMADSTVRTTNAHRTYYKESSPQSEFFRVDANNNTSENSIPSDYMRFRVYVTFNDLYIRELLLNFHDLATTDFDYGMESITPGGAINDASWNVPYSNLVTQALPYAIDLQIPIKLNADDAMAIEFNIGDIQNFDDNQSIYLFDQELNTYTDLRLNPYELNIGSGNYTDRFKIVFETAPTLDLDDALAASVRVYTNLSESQLIVNNPNLMPLANLKLYDLNGRLVLENPFQSLENKYILPINHLPTSVYMVMIVSDNGAVFSQKVMISN